MENITFTHLPEDVLLVTGERDGRRLTARGWINATTNHFPAAAYDAETGHLKDDAQPRAMTEDELQAYAERLLSEQNP